MKNNSTIVIMSWWCNLGNSDMENHSRIASSVWWPEVSQQIAQTVQQCAECAKLLMISQLPEYPWQVVGTVLLDIDGAYCPLTTDYFLRYPELIKLTSTTSVIRALRSVFSGYRKQSEVVVLNGLSHRLISCWCQIGAIWRHSVKRTNSSNILRRKIWQTTLSQTANTYSRQQKFGSRPRDNPYKEK